jgi:hypothetical protein
MDNLIRDAVDFEARLRQITLAYQHSIELATRKYHRRLQHAYVEFEESVMEDFDSVGNIFEEDRDGRSQFHEHDLQSDGRARRAAVRSESSRADPARRKSHVPD